jgi:hypothetical protein
MAPLKFQGLNPPGYVPPHPSGARLMVAASFQR